MPDENVFNDSKESVDWDQDTSYDDVIPSAITVALESAPGGLQLIHHNVQGLISKSTELAHWLHNCQTMPAIFCYSETWLKNDLFMLPVDGFEQFYSPLLYRSHNSNSALTGSCMFMSSSLNPDLEQANICERVAGHYSVLNVTCCM